MKQLLYLMHVPWGWIKQRPHFLAEGLAAHYRIDLYSYRSYHCRWLTDNLVPPGLAVRNLWVIPCGYLSSFNTALVSAQLSRSLAKADLLWLSHPYHYGQLARCIPARCRVVYDCMDDLPNHDYYRKNAGRHAELLAVEQVLMGRSDLIFASSDHLREVLGHRSRCGDKIVTVNNASAYPETPTDAPDLPAKVAVAFAGPGVKVGYVGTLSNWFDWELVLDSLDRIPELVYVLAGPAYAPLPVHPRIRYLGPISHRHVHSVMTRADVLAMPFLLSDLIRSVDPVKLYEYVASGRPVIASRYGETEKFARHVYLYEDRNDYFELMGRAAAGKLPPKQDAAGCREFACHNSWSQRIQTIVPYLERLF